MINKSLIRGYGGGGGKSGKGGGETSGGQEAKDSLRSAQIATILDLLCEGEIEGVVNGLKSVYLDGTPVQNQNGTFNFSPVLFTQLHGTQGQSFIEGVNSVDREIPVFLRIFKATPITRSITDLDTNRIRITVSTPALLKAGSDGGIKGSSIDLKIEIQNNGGGFLEYISNKIEGKASSKYQRSYLITLPSGGPWDIKITRITNDSGSATLQNDLYWDTYTEIKDIKLTYPNSAIVGLALGSQQFTRIPSRAYDVKMLRIKIPSNYDPITRIYTGEWDGIFQVAWSDNPAWIYYDILINSRYGIGNYIEESNIDKWELYSIAQYCDELVPNGFGEMEPRFTCSVLINSRDEALNVIASLASVFRGMVYWQSGIIVPIQDRQKTASHLFTNANVTDGIFNYSGSSLKSRHTVALVSWINNDNLGRSEIEYVPDELGIAAFGINEIEVAGIGCTTRGQAYRVGKYILTSERLETETISFECGLDGTMVFPGAIFKTLDANRAGARFGGRLINVLTLSSIEIDSSITLSSGEVYYIHIMLPNGQFETKTILNSIGTYTILTLISDLSQMPVENAIWVVTASNLEAEEWRCLSVTEADTTKVEVTGLRYIEGKFNLIEQNILFDVPPTSLISIYPISPTNLKVTEQLYAINEKVIGNKVTISWDASFNATKYRLVYIINQENPVTIITSDTSYDIEDGIPGVWVITVTALSILNFPSASSQLTTTITGDTDPPLSIIGLTISSIGGNAVLRWNQSTELDVLVGGYVEFRHSPLLLGASWTQSTSIGNRIDGNQTTITLPLLSGSYLAKFVDFGGRYSDTESIVNTDGATVLAFANVTSVSEEPLFLGTLTSVVTSNGNLFLDGTINIDDWGNVDDINLWDYEGGVQLAGNYIFAAGIDLGTINRVRLRKILKATIIDIDDLFDTRLTNIDTWINFDGVTGNEADAIIYIRATDDDPNISPVWGNWNILDSAEYENRAFQFKVELMTFYENNNIFIDQLGITVDEVI